MGKTLNILGIMRMSSCTDCYKYVNSSICLYFVCRRVHVMSIVQQFNMFILCLQEGSCLIYDFVFVSGKRCLTHIVLCFCFVFLRLVYPMLSVSLDCPLLIAPSVFSNVYLLMWSTESMQSTLRMENYLQVLSIETKL